MKNILSLAIVSDHGTQCVVSVLVAKLVSHSYECASPGGVGVPNIIAPFAQAQQSVAVHKCLHIARLRLLSSYDGSNREIVGYQMLLVPFNGSL